MYLNSAHPCLASLIYCIRLSRCTRALCFQHVPRYIKCTLARAKPAHSFLRTAMTSQKKKRGKPIIHQDIPARPSVVVRAQEFKQSSGSRLVSTMSLSLSSSSRSSTPLPPQTAHEPPVNPTDIQVYSDVEGELLEKARKKKKKKPSRSVNVSTASCSSLPYPSPKPNQQTLLEEWLQYRDEFMDEWIRLESSSQLTCLPQCLGCTTPQATFRCVDCFVESLYCKECLLSSHRCEPFHSLQVFQISLHGSCG